jgi:hypothetical protein
MSKINNYLAELTLIDAQILDKLWMTINEIVTISQCDVFTYKPDSEDDPLTNGIQL